MSALPAHQRAATAPSAVKSTSTAAKSVNLSAAASKPKAPKSSGGCCCASKVQTPKSITPTTAAQSTAPVSTSKPTTTSQSSSKTLTNTSAPSSSQPAPPSVVSTRSTWDVKRDEIEGVSNKQKLEKEASDWFGANVEKLHDDLELTTSFIGEQTKIYRDSSKTADEKFRAAFLLAEIARASAAW